MPVGLETYSDDGILQLGLDSSPFTLVESGTFTLAYQSIGANPYLTSFAISDGWTTPLVAIVKDNGTACWLIRGTIIGAERIMSVASTSSGTGKFYVFDYTPTASPATYGLEIFDSSTGALLYNSGITPPMRVVGFGSNITGLPSGRQYAAGMDGLYPGTFADPSYGTLRTIECATVTATSVVVSRKYLRYVPPIGFGLGTYSWVTPTISDPAALKGKAIAIDVKDLV